MGITSKVLASVLIVGSSMLMAQLPRSTWEPIKLSDKLYELRADGGGYIVKVLASIGPDGVLLVDSGQRKAAKDLLQTLKSLGGGTPRMIINSHSHQEHVAGNLGLGKGPLIIGHSRLRERLKEGEYLFSGYNEDSLPRLTLTDELKLHFNNEEIRIKAFPGAHDDCDLVIHFTKSKVAFVGALATACKFPSLDASGDILKYPEISTKMLDWLPQDVRLVPGHGEDATPEQGRQFVDMIRKTTALVRAELAKGKDKEALKKMDLLKDWRSWEVSYVKRNDWIDTLVSGLTRKPAAGPRKPTIHKALHQVLEERGAAAIPAAYAALKAGQGHEIDELMLAEIGYILFHNERMQDAIPFFELSVKDYPTGPYCAFSFAYLGTIHQQLGDWGKSKECYQKALAIEPGIARAQRGLKELEERR